MGENSLCPTKGLTNLLIWKLLRLGCSKQDLKGSALPSLASCSETLRNRLYLAEAKNPKVKFIFWASWFAPNITLPTCFFVRDHPLPAKKSDFIGFAISKGGERGVGKEGELFLPGAQV